MKGSNLLSVLNLMLREDVVAMVRFNDGEIYNLMIDSTMHAEEGGDVIARVVRVGDEPILGKFPEGEFINFFLVDVDQVSIAGECVFARLPNAFGLKPETRE